MGFVLAKGIHTADGVLCPAKSKSLPDFGIHYLADELIVGDRRFRGGKSKQGSRQAILRGVLMLYEAGFVDEAKKLVGHLASRKVFYKTLQEIVAMHFGLTDYRLRR